MISILLLSGLWPTNDQNGLNSLASKIQTISSQFNIKVMHYDDKNLPLADCYIGHSLGAESAFKLITANPDRPVKYFASIDGVWGDWFSFFFWKAAKHMKIPAHVERADAFQRSWPLVPPSSKILNPSSQYLNFLNISMSHAEAPKNSAVVFAILSQIQNLL